MFLDRGDVLGAYTVIKLLGVGGMGSVYLAVRRDSGQQVAIKVLHEKWLKRRSVVRRFFAEAHAASQIDHENILKVIDFVARDSQGLYFMVMEVLEGVELHELLEDGPLEPVRCALIGRQIASALAAAHAKGIVHRDLKPENVFLTTGAEGADTVKVLDFGVAKLVEKDALTGAGRSEHETSRGTTLGTPAYMSPEQICGRPVDGRSDIYSLGIILYEMLTCRRPFESASFGEMVYKHSAMTPKRPSCRSSIASPIPPQLDDLVMRCLEKRPEDRPQSMIEVRDVLDAILSSRRELDGEPAGG